MGSEISVLDGRIGDAAPRWALSFQGPAEQRFVDGIVEAVTLFLTNSPQATEEDRMLFALAMSEIMTNVVQHGGEHASMRLDFELHEDSLRARVTDSAASTVIDWSAVAMPDEHAESGRGLALALTVLDDLRHEPTEIGNTWWLRRNLPREGGSRAEQQQRD